MNIRVLTGITTSGTPHLGNYVGAIRPAVEASRQADVDAFYFLADYHALIKCEDADRIARSRLEIAATWLACGLDPASVTFYRQSDVPEIPELCWMLTCVTAKGLMNRAHAYKASVDQNAAKGVDEDDGVTMGLFSYPVLMAADILLFNAHKVPVGRDQLQHLEMARDIAQRFNSQFGRGRDYFVLPEAVISEDVAVLPGLDGRKMSKSYNNTVPLFEGGARALKSAIARIVTDSRGPGEPKDPDNSHLYLIYRAFAKPEQAAFFRSELIAGLGWGDAKRMLCEMVEAELEPMRDHYEDLMAHPPRIEEILQAGAHKARSVATPFIRELRDAVGLRALVGGATPVSGKGQAAKSVREARFVSFRDETGQFRFRLLSPAGDEILCSVGYADPKDAGKVMGRLKASQGAVDDLVQIVGDTGFTIALEGQVIAEGAASDSAEARDRLLAALRAALG
jgi:tryptophanyl-tRNA synthetase